jgi:hypothetical protein
MPNNKKDILQKKKVFNSSLRTSTILAFEHDCMVNDVSPNDVLESLILEYLRKPEKK